MRRFALPLIFLLSTLSFLSKGQSVRNVGTGEEFTNLTAVAAWLNANTLTQNTDFVLKDSYVGTSESIPITIQQNSGNFTVRIRKEPTTSEINTVANAPGPIFLLDGADRVILDGLGKWTIKNTSPGGVGIKLQNGATFNEIRNLKIYASGTSGGEGAISVSGEGNNNNTIKGNLIASPASPAARQIEYIANLPARPEVPSTTIEHIHCLQEGADARLRVSMVEDHQLVPGYPVKLNEICGMTAANGTYTIASVPSSKVFEVVKAGYTCPAVDSFKISKLYVHNSIDRIVNLGGSLKFKMLHPVKYLAGDKIRVSGVRGLTDANGEQTIASVNPADSSFTVALNSTQSYLRGVVVRANGDTLVPIRNNYNPAFVSGNLYAQKICFARPHKMVEFELFSIYYVGAFKRDTLLNQRVEAVIDPYTIVVNIAPASYKTNDLVYVSPTTIRVNADSTKDILRVKHIKGYHEASRLSHEGNVDFTLTESTSEILPGTIVRCVGATNPGDGPYMGMVLGWSKFNPTHYHYSTWHSVFPKAGNPQMLTTGRGFSGINPYCPAYISGPMMARTTEPHNLATGDQITIKDAPGLETVPGNYTITVLDARNFVLNGSTWYEYVPPASILGTNDYAFRFFKRTTTARFNNNIVGNKDTENGVVVGIPDFLFPWYEQKTNVKTLSRPARGVLLDGQIPGTFPLGEFGLNNVQGDSIEFVGVTKRYWKMKGTATDQDKYFATQIHNHATVLYNAYYQTDLLTAPAIYIQRLPLLFGITVSNGGVGSTNIRIESNALTDPNISGIKMTGPATGWAIDTNRIYFNQVEPVSLLTGIDVSGARAGGSFIRSNYLGADTSLSQSMAMNQNHLYAIQANVSGPGSLIISDNLIASFTFPGFPKTRKTAGFFRGIVHSGGRAEIRNNQFRDISVSFFSGIEGSSDSGLVAINNQARNILSDIPEITASGPIYRHAGVYYRGGGRVQIQGNDFRNFRMTRSGNQFGGGINDVPMGIITVNNSSPDNIIARNFIEFKNTSGACVPNAGNFPNSDYGCGILLQGTSAGLIDANRVGYYAGDEHRRESKPMVGIRVLSTTSSTQSWRISNNMVRMLFTGMNRSSRYITEDPQSGITITSGRGGKKHEVYNNSVYVGYDGYWGEYTGRRYSCLAITSNGAAKVYNNIFINANGWRYNSPARADYTCIAIANLANYEGDHNAYFWGCPWMIRTGKTVPYYGYAKIGGRDYMDYQSMIDTLRKSGNDLNSINSDAPFVHPPLGLFGWPQRDLLEKDLALGENGVHLVGKGKDLGITTDYYGNTRPSLPTLGAHEISANAGNAWIGAVSSEWNNPANWSAGTVPGAGTNVFISNLPEKRFMPDLDGLAEVKDITINQTPGGFMRIKKNGHLKIYGKAQFYNEFTLVNTLGSRVEYAGTANGQEICGLRTGVGPYTSSRTPYGNANDWSGAPLQFFTFETESYSRGAISNVDVSAVSINLTFAAPHGLRPRENIYLWGLTGALAPLNGLRLRLATASGTTATVSGNGFPAGSQAGGVEYTNIRKWFDVTGVANLGGSFRVTLNTPHGFVAGQQLNGSTDTVNRRQVFLMVDSIIDAYNFVTRSPLTASYFVAAGSTGYAKLKVSGGVKGIYGPAEVFERLEFDNTTIKSDYYPDGTMYYAYLFGTRMIPRFPILRKLDFLSGTTPLNQVADFTGVSPSAYVDGPCAVEFGNYWTGTRWIPVGKNGKHRPMRVQINPNPSPDPLGGRGFYMMGEMFDGKATDKFSYVRDPNYGNSLDHFANNYFRLEMFAYEATVQNTCHEEYYQAYYANYAQNSILPVENQINIKNLTVGVSYLSSDIPQATNRNIVVVKDSGEYTPGQGMYTAAWKDYTPTYWTDIGKRSQDSTSALYFVEGNTTLYPGYYSVGAVDQYSGTIVTHHIQPSVPEIGVRIYPNPASDHLTIQVDGYQSSELYTISGLLVKTTSKETISVSDLKPGVYLLKIRTLDGKTSLHKMMKSQ